MPPRAAPGSGRGRGRGAGTPSAGAGSGSRGGGLGGRGRGGGQGAPRGTGGAPRGSYRGSGPATRSVPSTVAAGRLPDASPHITTIGVKRPSFGSSGRALDVKTNHYEVKIPDANIHHYDGMSLSRSP